MFRLAFLRGWPPLSAIQIHVSKTALCTSDMLPPQVARAWLKPAQSAYPGLGRSRIPTLSARLRAPGNRKSESGLATPTCWHLPFLEHFLLLLGSRDLAILLTESSELWGWEVGEGRALTSSTSAARSTPLELRYRSLFLTLQSSGVLAMVSDKWSSTARDKSLLPTLPCPAEDSGGGPQDTHPKEAGPWKWWLSPTQPGIRNAG